MWKKLTLRSRIYTVLASLVFISFTGGAVMVWYTYRIQNLLSEIIEKHMASFQIAAAMETALVNQKGYVTYYFLDSDPDWLEQFGEYRNVFKVNLDKAKAAAGSEDE